MTQFHPTKKCIKCNEDFFNCNCEQYHPSIYDESLKDFRPKYIVKPIRTLNLSEEEALSLYTYLSDKWIGNEFSFEITVHSLIKRLKEFIK